MVSTFDCPFSGHLLWNLYVRVLRWDIRFEDFDPFFEDTAAVTCTKGLSFQLPLRPTKAIHGCAHVGR
jgi:hypothetical protein